MSSERDRTRLLADEVRRAVAASAPPGTLPVAPDSASPEERAVHRAAERAQGYLTPSVPTGVRLSSVKRAAVRALRFVWRDQASFNALTLEALDALREGLARERQRRLDAILRVEREEAERARWSAAWERRGAIYDGRFALLEAEALTGRQASGAAVPDGARGGEGDGSPSGLPPLPPAVYSLFEERFRGSPEEISRKQRSYLPFLEGAPGPVLDVGCGRGEFLGLLREAGLSASGVEVNPIAAAECRALGLDVEEGDGLSFLASRPAASLGAVVALQVVEHWTPEAIFAFLREARRALAPGGLLVAETINTDSLSAWKAFFLDPSHVRPVPPEALRFLAQAAGFADVRIELLSPLPADARLEESSANDVKLNGLLFGPQDYAVLARSPERPAGA
ncbi:MAG: class I SAM-dependent methyltransferase [Thermoanaerobaculia bacterium]